MRVRQRTKVGAALAVLAMVCGGLWTRIARRPVRSEAIADDREGAGRTGVAPRVISGRPPEWMYRSTGPMRPIRGIVRADGAPVAAAKVVVRLADIPDVDLDETALVTDSSGWFDLGERPVGAYVVVATKEGRSTGA